MAFSTLFSVQCLNEFLSPGRMHESISSFHIMTEMEFMVKQIDTKSYDLNRVPAISTDVWQVWGIFPNDMSLVCGQLRKGLKSLGMYLSHRRIPVVVNASSKISFSSQIWPSSTFIFMTIIFMFLSSIRRTVVFELYIFGSGYFMRYKTGNIWNWPLYLQFGK